MLVALAMVTSAMRTGTAPMRSRLPHMSLLDGFKNLMTSAQAGETSSVQWDESNSRGPEWETLGSTLHDASTEEERNFRADLESGRLDRACSLATKRLFDLPEGEEPAVTLYRDTAAWCPYCEKVWLTLEEKRVPYKVEKVNMNCYGDKPGWFWAMQPSGGIPVAKVNGDIIRESNDIIMAVENAYPEIRLLPAAGEKGHERVNTLLGLERELFSSWFRWLTSSMQDGAQRITFEGLLRRVDEELAVGGGPFFLGEKVSLVDCFFAPFLERMAASCAYYKGVTLRRNDEWPRIEQWFVAMEARPSYRHIQSDFYTHVNDLPPQVGRCFPSDGSEAFARHIDGEDGSWSLPLPDVHDAGESDLLQPLIGLGQEADAAKREAAERLIHNHAAVARFAARGLAGAGFPPVSAELSDPNAKPDDAALPLVSTLLRHTAHSLLEGPEAARAQLSVGIEPMVAAKTLGYLRDRISVPRDMSYPAARQLRAHLNDVIEGVGAAAAAKA